MKSSIREILAITFYKIKYSKFIGDHINVTISGWEPSIFQKETIFSLKYFTEFFRKRDIKVTFDLQSNASNIDEVFASKLAKLWVQQALISSHAHDPEIFQKIIGVDYLVMWPRFDIGVRSLIHAGVSVTFNIVLNNLNKDHYFDHVQYLMQKYPSVSLYNIGYVQPHGMAQENFGNLVGQYSEIEYIYNKVIAFLKSHGKKVHSHLVWLPLCYLNEWGSSMEYMHNKNLFSKNQEQTLIQAINDDNKVHPLSCNLCPAKRVCSGVWKEFENFQKLKPYTYKLVQWDTSFSDNQDQISREYSGGKRQFFVLVEWLSESLEDILLHIRSLWYAWVSLIFNNYVSNIDYKKFAGMNIQILAKDKGSTSQLIDTILKYNLWTQFQFRIHLDVLIYPTHLWKIDEVISLPRNSDICIHLPKNDRSNKAFLKDFIYFSL